MKTPKEKAKELVERFMEYSHTEFISYRGGYQLDTQIQNAKQCALIAVDEIMKLYPYLGKLTPGNDEAEYNLIKWGKEYWQEVKQEIENL
jgi:hypothetical protein